jgi:hypothetical protein
LSAVESAFASAPRLQQEIEGCSLQKAVDSWQ